MDVRVITAIVAVIGIPLLLVGYIQLGEWLLARLPRRIGHLMRPYVWVFPAVAFATVFMVLPTINTIIISFQDAKGNPVGLANYVFFFTNPETLTSLKNNVLWLVFFTGFVVFFGLFISILFDRVKYESIAKIAVFLPLPISSVAASVIWKFMFEFQPKGQVQTGTLNAFIGTVGFDPIAWLINTTTNNFALIAVGVWTSTGFAMVIISAALKGISNELLEAARVDGANELQVIRRVIVPLLMPTLTVITTTMIITALKVFDIVYVLTSGAFGTDVIARQLFQRIANSDYGRAAAVGVVLLLAVTPILLFNIRSFRQQEEVR
ncbi:MAG TPA: sugar ABC transporter permease [Candidatus Limnocylindrales bacterium]|nr:sugar ABC transporter permease [Candidatus Limnocylindrales bacterium]HEV8697900.1 sugar ABC transporter permease [Candidatus Limnocylindrales bacterium]